MSGLAVVLNTGDEAPVLVLLYSFLSYACATVAVATSSTAIHIIRFIIIIGFFPARGIIFHC